MEQNQKNHSPLILIVDDDQMIHKLLGAILQRAGYSCIYAKDGQEGLQMASEHKPELIILDIIMPGINGFEVMRQLKSLPETSAIPVIFLSGKIHSKEKTQARDLGAADFVEKPFERTEILSRVQTYLKIRRQADNLSFFNTRITQLAKEALGLLGYEQAQELNRLPEFLSINLAKATREALNSLQVMESQWSVVYTFIKPYMTGQTEHSSREALLLLPETLACLRQQIEAIDSVSSQLSAVTGLQSEEGNGSA